MAIDPLKPKTNLSKLLETEQVQPAKPAAPPAPIQPPAPAQPHIIGGFVDPKEKPLSITGKAKAHAPTASGPVDVKSLVADLKSNLPPGVQIANNLTVGSNPTKAGEGNALKKAIDRGADDEELRNLINHDPKLLKELSAEDKGKALKRLESGYVSEGDAHAMKQVALSCDSKEELRAVVGHATGKDPATLEGRDFHDFDEHIAEYNKDMPYLIADKLNPANTSIPEKAPPPEPPGSDNLPPSLQPGQEIDDGNRVNQKVDGRTVRQFKTGENITKVPDGELDATPAQQAETKKAQQKVIDDMKAKGLNPSDPPTVAQAKEYLAKVAGKGTPAEVAQLKTALGDYLKAYYVHAGQGADWGAGKNLANDMEKAFADQPKLKDGRTVIDCEGFAALTENLLKDIKEPSGKPMFEMMQGATRDHAIVGVFRRGDPLNKPFMVSNDRVTDIPQHAIDNAKKLNTKGQIASTEKFVLRELIYDEVNGGHEQRLKADAKRPSEEQRPSLEAGRTFDSRKKFF